MKKHNAGKFPWLFQQGAWPNAIAHRGASDYAFDNSLTAFARAAELGAQWIEVDVRTTADGVLIAWHDPTLRQITGQADRIDALNVADIEALARSNDRELARFDAVLQLASERGLGVYVDAKDAQAVDGAGDALLQHGIEHGVIAAFNRQSLRALATRGCRYPLAVLVPVGEDWQQLAEETQADIVHLCWERIASSAEPVVTEAMIGDAAALGLAVVLWHEERPAILDTLVTLPVFGICSNKPEMMTAYRDRRSALQLPGEDNSAYRPIVVCHRGYRRVAPENTLAAARCAFSAGYEVVELDVHASADGELFVIHDRTVDRTTNGSGSVADLSAAQIQALDAGGEFDRFYDKEPVPTFDQILALTRALDGRLYVELKNAPAESVLERVNAHDMLERCFFWSFNAQSLKDIRKLSADASIMCRCKDFPTLHEAIHFVNAGLIEFDALVDDLSEVTSCQQAGFDAMVAYNGDDPEVFEEILSNRPKMLNLDRPDVLRAVWEGQLRKWSHAAAELP